MQATRNLGPAHRVDEGEFGADPATKGAAAVEMFPQDRGNPRTRRLVPQIHCAMMTRYTKNRVVQPLTW